MSPGIDLHMKRRAVVGILLLGIVLSLSFLAPLVPVNIIENHSAICPPKTVGLCSIGDGVKNVPGFGSPTYLLFGVGGAWSGHFEILQKGCSITDNGALLLCIY